MKAKLIATLAASFFVVGCSTTSDYYKSVDASNARAVEASRAQSEADAARYMALSRIAESGDSAAKVAAVMALALGGQGRTPNMAVAQAPQNEALQWASILVPGVTQGLSIYYGAKQNMNASDNATKLGINTNQTFGQFASEINDPTVVMQPTPTIVTSPDPIIVRPEVVKPEVVRYEAVQPEVIQITP